MCHSEQPIETPPLVHLHLRTPIEYEPAPGLDLFACQEPSLPPAAENAGELLFCFDLDPGQAGRIDPQADRFIGNLVFSGRQKAGGENCLAAGLYLFAQQRRALNRDECIALAIEQHKDGLWERLSLENRLYIRRLFEDGSPVTQILRPYSQG